MAELIWMSSSKLCIVRSFGLILVWTWLVIHAMAHWRLDIGSAEGLIQGLHWTGSRLGLLGATIGYVWGFLQVLMFCNVVKHALSWNFVVDSLILHRVASLAYALRLRFLTRNWCRTWVIHCEVNYNVFPCCWLALTLLMLHVACLIMSLVIVVLYWLLLGHGWMNYMCCVTPRI